MQNPKVESRVVQEPRAAIYRHEASYIDPITGARLEVQYQGPIEETVARVTETYESVNRDPNLRRTLIRLDLVGVINVEGDEEILSYQTKVPA
jgi:hypothetical protein